jgi:hypothetical protein
VLVVPDIRASATQRGDDAETERVILMAVTDNDVHRGCEEALFDQHRSQGWPHHRITDKWAT